MLDNVKGKICLTFISPARKGLGQKELQKCHSRRSRSSLRVSAHLTGPPNNTTLRSHIQRRNHRTTFENTPICPPKYSIVRWVGAVPDFFEGVESSYFCYLGPHAKFQNPRTTFENTPLCPPKYSIVRGVGGSPVFFRVSNPHIFVTNPT